MIAGAFLWLVATKDEGQWLVATKDEGQTKFRTDVFPSQQGRLPDLAAFVHRQGRWPVSVRRNIE